MCDLHRKTRDLFNPRVLLEFSIIITTPRLVAILSVEDPRLHDDGGGTAKDASKGVKPCWVTGGEHSDCLGLMTALGAFEFSGER